MSLTMSPANRDVPTDVTDGLSNSAENPYADRIVTHKRIGVWDYYEEQDPDGRRLPSISSWVKKCSDVVESLPYAIRMIKDILDIPGIRGPLLIYVAAQLGSSVIPAASIW